MIKLTGVFALGLPRRTTIARAQAPTATVHGQVRDTSDAAIPNATVEVINNATRVHYTTETNSEGIYSVPSLPPGTYHIQVSKTGFKTIIYPDIVLNVQDAKAIGFTLPIGPMSEAVTVKRSEPLIGTTAPAAGILADSSTRGGWLSMLREFVFDFSEAMPLIMLLILECCGILWFLDKLHKLLH